MRWETTPPARNGERAIATRGARRLHPSLPLPARSCAPASLREALHRRCAPPPQKKKTQKRTKREAPSGYPPPVGQGGGDRPTCRATRATLNDSRHLARCPAPTSRAGNGTAGE